MKVLNRNGATSQLNDDHLTALNIARIYRLVTDTIFLTANGVNFFAELDGKFVVPTDVTTFEVSGMDELVTPPTPSFLLLSPVTPPQPPISPFRRAALVNVANRPNRFNVSPMAKPVVKSFTIVKEVRPGHRPFGDQVVTISLPEKDVSLSDYLEKLTEYVAEPILLNVTGSQLMESEITATVTFWK